MRFFCCGFSKDNRGLTHINFRAFVKNLVAVQEYTFHVTVPRSLSTLKQGYQHQKGSIFKTLLQQQQ
jgi:hypothetical protein